MSFFTDPSRKALPLMVLKAYKSIERKSSDEVGRLELPFDYKNMTNSYENKMAKPDVIHSDSGDTQYRGAKDSGQEVTFILDDTTYQSSTDFLSAAPQSQGSVDSIIKDLYKYAQSVAGDIHQPHFLTLSSHLMPFAKGAGSFDCCLASMTVENKIVDEKGNRIKAMVKCRFVENLSREQIDARDKKNSPDLTHRRRIVAGENLPYKTFGIYNEQSLYVAVAEFNQLDSLRDLQLGDILAFPPLER